LLLVDKPAGITSHDVVDRIRRAFQFRKVGHGGTLDPMATGLLILLIGRATRASAWVMNNDKTYEGVMRLGVATSTEDRDGAVTSEGDSSGVTEAMVREQMARRTGDQMQTPPMVSAVKKDGVPLYKLARKGREVERPARLIHVVEFSLLSFQPPDAAFRLRCTKGTYVRTLCADIGRELGCGAHLSSLRRTQAGEYLIADALPLDRILADGREELWNRLLPIPRPFVGS
jgi:tRNA pseudouridine55 synthase